jgi:hypothetical protein
MTTDAKDAEIARLREELAAERQRAEEAEAMVSRRDYAIAKIQEISDQLTARAEEAERTRDLAQAASTRDLEAKREAERQLEVARGSLERYCDTTNWDWKSKWIGVEDDPVTIARAALAQMERKP